MYMEPPNVIQRITWLVVVTQDFNNDMLSHQREVSDTLETGDKLLKDSELPEDDRTAIQKEVLDLSHRWENLEELVTWKTERYCNSVRHS